jgi:hypothetical protein
MFFMKKLIFKAIFCTLSIAFIFFACSKDRIEGKMPKQTSSNIANITQSSKVNDDETIIRINEFKQRLQQEEYSHGSFRGGEPMTKETAVWNIEALLNATYSESDKTYALMDVKTSTISMPISNNQVSDATMLSVYNNAKQSLVTQFTVLNKSNRHVILLDVNVENITSTQVDLTVTSIIGYGTSSLVKPLTCTNVFGSTDDWKWGFQGGKCENPVLGLDATDKLEEAANLTSPLNSGHIYYTNIEKVIIDVTKQQPKNLINPNDVLPKDNHRDYLVYKTYEAIAMPNFEETACIDDADMNFYYCNLLDIINFATPTGKTFVSVDVIPKNIGQVGFGSRRHDGIIRYGISHTCESNTACPPVGACSQTSCVIW